MRRAIPTIAAAALAAVIISACGSSPHEAVARQTTTTTTTPIAPTVPSGAYIAPSAARGDLGKTETVRFYVARTYTDADGTEFLDQCQNYASCFVDTIYASDVANFTSDPATTYLYDKVDVTGTISYYGGYYEILNPTNIQVVS
jgi:hypothetical protein